MKPSDETTKDLPETKEANASEAPRMRLPGFILDEDIGLGDAIKRLTSSVGIKPCGQCAQRAAILNSWLVISGK